jgi:hypothetical protein
LIPDPRLPLPPPSIPKEEFIHRVSANWKDASLDDLDIVISLLMVSAPGSIYGIGGLGSEGLESMRLPGKGTSRDVAKTIMDQLPVEFRMKTRSPYRYSVIDSMRSRTSFKRERAKENTFTILASSTMRYSERSREEDIPIQMPFVLSDSQMTSKKEGMDLDVLEYQLSALYMPPPSEEVLAKKGEEMMRITRRESAWPGFGDVIIDPFSGIRIGLALSRLQVGKEFNGRSFSRRPGDIEKGNELFNDLMKRGMEEIERSLKKEKMMDTTVQLPWREKLKPLDREIYFDLRKNAEDSGILDISRESIELKVPEHEVDRSLERLNRYGYILFMKGGTVIRVLVNSEPERSS